MIKSFKNQGLENFYKCGNAENIDSADKDRLKRILAIIDAADELRDFNIPSLNFTKENDRGLYSLRVCKGKKIVFRLVSGKSDKE